MRPTFEKAARFAMACGAVAAVALGAALIWPHLPPQTQPVLLLAIAGALGLGVAYSVTRCRQQISPTTRSLVGSLADNPQISDKLALVAARTDNGVVITDAQGNIEWVNDGFTRLNGYTLAEVAGKKPGLFLQGPQTDQHMVEFMRRKILAGEGFETQLLNYRKDGLPFWVAMDVQPIRDEAGKLTNFIAIQRDVTQWKETQQKLLHHSTHDALTGLPNRLLMLDRLDRCIQRNKREPGRRFAVFFLDLDRFKLINDTLGHQAGDHMLVEVAQRLCQCLRGSDSVARPSQEHTVARLGGDEFTVLLDGIREDSDALRVADRLHDALARPIDLDGHEVVTGASIGIALSDQQYETAQDLLRDADNAMYRAKKLGGGRYMVFDQAMHEKLRARFDLESDLRHALERGQICLHYQPVINLHARGLAGFEALVRWHHPQRGLLTAGEFLPLAEEIGVIVPLRRWVLGEAARQIKLWHAIAPELAHLFVSTNLSVKQFHDGELPALIRTVLAEHDIPPSALRVEVAEATIMRGAGHSERLVADLKALGIGVDLDDFGRGESSLMSLHHQSVHGLKLDRRFIDSLAASHGYNDLIKAMVALAHSLNMTVVAKGVESVDQLALFEALGCDMGQGYYFARPMPADAVDSFVEHYLHLPARA
ncbi:MAG: EAL domain-containing protein [Phycisphaeraceae bacterium]